jgi:hypothetical protein
MNALNSYTLQGSPRTTVPSFAVEIGKWAAQGWSAVAGHVANWLRPHPESPAEAATRLRRLADQYRDNPSHAADLRAAADRHFQ